MKEITEEKYNYHLEVLPPCVMGTEYVVCFLKEFDHNTELVETIEKKNAKALFVQGEGWDKFQVYGMIGKKYYYLGETMTEWDTENFRYPDGEVNMAEKIMAKVPKKCVV